MWNEHVDKFTLHQTPQRVPKGAYSEKSQHIELIRVLEYEPIQWDLVKSSHKGITERFPNCVLTGSTSQARYYICQTGPSLLPWNQSFQVHITNTPTYYNPAVKQDTSYRSLQDAKNFCALKDLHIFLEKTKKNLTSLADIITDQQLKIDKTREYFQKFSQITNKDPIPKWLRD